MKWLAMLLFALSVTWQNANAQESRISAYGINYQEHTFNEILTDFMYGIEPKLLKHYEQLNLTKEEKIWGLEGMAEALAMNNIFSTIIKDIEAADPDATAAFTKLPKERYSKLHLLAKHFRIKKEYKEKFGVELTEKEAKSNLKLYRALFGKEYEADKETLNTN